MILNVKLNLVTLTKLSLANSGRNQKINKLTIFNYSTPEKLWRECKSMELSRYEMDFKKKISKFGGNIGVSFLSRKISCFLFC